MFRKKTIIVLISFLLLTACLTDTEKSKEKIVMGNKITVTINTNAERKPISPYIYGVNDFVMNQNVTVFSVRQGGNRYTAYNWENNFSNAGNDWNHFNDTYLSTSSSPAAVALKMAEDAKEKNIPYMITTLQMAGYVSADSRHTVYEDETAPSRRFKEVVFAKNSPFADTPDLNDNYVYMDEYVNYLVNKLGPGVMHYNLDNEPALWSETHPRVHPEETGAGELLEKSAALAAAVKAVDPKAEIHGPALYGIAAYNDFHNPADWEEIKKSKNYDWFISYYLDEMATRSEKAGLRLLDSIDVHFYSEARGECRVTECNNDSHADCINARVQSTRTLWQAGYYENSWVGRYMRHTLPVINRLNHSIEKYYPGTKLSFTEYNLGGGEHISGAVAQADILGIFGKMGVYLATLWPLASNCEYQLSAINLYTNYDGKGSSFGNTHVFAETSSIEDSFVYASIKNNDESVLTITAANKSLTFHHDMEIIIESPVSYNTYTPYMITKESSRIIKAESLFVTENSFTIRLPPLTAVQLVLESM